jgi:hypothetical protein
MTIEIFGLDLQKKQIFEEGLPNLTLQSAGINFKKVKLRKKKETMLLSIEGTIDGKDFLVYEEGRHFHRLVDDLRDQIFRRAMDPLGGVIS